MPRKRSRGLRIRIYTLAHGRRLPIRQIDVLTEADTALNGGKERTVEKTLEIARRIGDCYGLRHTNDRPTVYTTARMVTGPCVLDWIVTWLDLQTMQPSPMTTQGSTRTTTRRSWLKN